MVGIVPVIYTPELDVIVGISGSANSSITSEITQSLTFNAGIRYLKDQGWSPYRTLSKNLGYQPPQLNMNSNAEAYVKPELKLEVLGVAGPYANLKLYERLNANILQNPWWTLSGGITMSAGAEVSILDLFTLDFTISDLLKYEQILAQATTPRISLPQITTTGITSITQTSAKGGGNITSDGGASITSRGVCWSTSQNPTTTNSHTSDGTDTGSFTSSLTGLTSNTNYYVRAYATNSAGTAYGSQVNFTTLIDNLGTVTDIDGNVYNTVTIGNQVWMAKNLATTHYSNGTALIDGAGVGDIYPDMTTRYYFVYNDDASKAPIYGLLYTWAAVMNGASSSDGNPSGVQGVCPTGWHVPSDSEFKELEMYLGMSQNDADAYGDRGTDQGTKLKLNGTSGFNVLLSGFRGNYINSNAFWSLGVQEYLITSTTNLDTEDAVIGHVLQADKQTINRFGYDKRFMGFSVRCIKDQ